MLSNGMIIGAKEKCQQPHLARAGQTHPISVGRTPHGVRGPAEERRENLTKANEGNEESPWDPFFVALFAYVFFSFSFSSAGACFWTLVDPSPDFFWQASRTGFLGQADSGFFGPPRASAIPGRRSSAAKPRVQEGATGCKSRDAACAGGFG
jgi:hypothetical protein